MLSPIHLFTNTCSHSTHPDLVPDGFIYMRADPETCLRRMHHRSRTEESSVPLDYLESLHMKHDEWLLNGSLSVAQINNPGLREEAREGVEVNGGLLLVKPEPEAIKGQVRFLRVRLECGRFCVTTVVAGDGIQSMC